jgi:hypothetical protein
VAFGPARLPEGRVHGEGEWLASSWSGFWPPLLPAVAVTLTFDFFFVRPLSSIAGGRDRTTDDEDA